MKNLESMKVHSKRIDNRNLNQSIEAIIAIDYFNIMHSVAPSVVSAAPSVVPSAALPAQLGTQPVSSVQPSPRNKREASSPANSPNSKRAQITPRKHPNQAPAEVRGRRLGPQRSTLSPMTDGECS